MVRKVYDLLKERTAEIATKRQQFAALEAKINSNRYTQEALKEIYPQRDRLRREIQDDAARAERDARQIVEAYQEELRREDDLDPAEITDDLKLLTSGIDLTEQDLNAILRRNASNRTMTQLAVRYGKAHDLLKATFYAGNEQKIKDAGNVNEVVHLYTSHWIDKDNAGEMLDKFFVTGGNGNG